MKLDIKTVKNAIGGRQGIAYVCNSAKFAVLKADIDTPSEYKDFRTFGNVRVEWTYKGQTSYTNGTLEVENGKWSIGGHGACLKADFGFSDIMELIDNANAPIIRTNDIVAIAVFSKENGFVMFNLFKVGRIDIHSITMATLTPLTVEEMEEVKNDAKRWCNR